MSFEDDLRKFEGQVKNFTIAGASGSFEHGFVIGGEGQVAAPGEGGGGGAVMGCTDPESNNFNPDATVDDGSCTYDPTTMTVAFSGQTKCCFTSGGFEYRLNITDLDISVDLIQTGENFWEASDPACFTGLAIYALGDCPDTPISGDGGFGCFPGSVTASLSGDVWTLQSWTVVDGVNFYDFDGSDTATIISNSLVSCDGATAAIGGTMTITVLPH